ncbi:MULTISPECIES: FAD-dependent monooxygenase [unclassified Mycobacterium]|uniref:FAD-dependent monooxygenase n=1 Tax=unclassified Mycobacterium TaxID=2642494 RepID=UPI0009DD2D31|nr:MULTISPECIES: FAD-dependent monooxygenase [unclassified Mycobacterium]
MSADGSQDCYDVAVIGLGPVGELAAILLARSGLRVLAVDREADVYGNPRVGVLDGEALRSLQKAGVYEEAVVDMISGAGAQWASRAGAILATTMPTKLLRHTRGCRPSINRYWIATFGLLWRVTKWLTCG